LERQGLCRTYLAHHELESKFIIITGYHYYWADLVIMITIYHSLLLLFIIITVSHYFWADLVIIITIYRLLLFLTIITVSHYYCLPLLLG